MFVAHNGSLTVKEETRRSDQVPLAIDHYNPVDATVSEAVGTTFLALLALLLLIALLRSQARHRRLLRQLAREGWGG